MTTKQKKSQKRGYEELILDYLQSNPSGLTISDIAKGINASRMTVSKYVSILEAKEKIVPKKIGAYNLYFSAHPVYIPKKIIMLFYLGLLQGLNERKIPDKEQFYKNLGYRISENLKVLFKSNLNVPEDIEDYSKFIRNLARIYPNIDVLNDIEINIVPEIGEKGLESVFHFKNVQLFGESEDFLYHFYIISGIIEKTMSRLIGKQVNCEIEYVNYSDRTVGLSIEIIPEKNKK